LDPLTGFYDNSLIRLISVAEGSSDTSGVTYKPKAFLIIADFLVCSVIFLRPWMMVRISFCIIEFRALKL
jgi:hypothetical protein